MNEHKKTMDSKKNKLAMNLTNERISQIHVPLKMVEFTPLKSWPAVPHPRQSRLDEFREIPSRWV